MKKPTAKLRWSKFWWGDWQNDAALKMCSYGARGLWIEMLAIMHAAEPQGHLLVNGRSPSPRQLAALTGGVERDVARFLEELEAAGVFSRNSEGVIYSRRMLRDIAASEAGRANGLAGGNPVLTGKSASEGYVGGLTPTSTQGVKLEAEAEAEREAERKTPPTPRVRGQGALEGFAEFRRYYPRREKWGAAEKAWPAAVKAAGGDPDDIVNGLKARLHIEQLFPSRDGGKYIPLPATWLRAKGWEDAIPGLDSDDINPSLPLH